MPCTIIGDGPYKSKVLELKSGSNYSNDISILGHVDNTNDFYDEAQFLSVLSENEGFGLVIVEALMRGLPVVSSNCQSGPSFILAKDKELKFGQLAITELGSLLPVPNKDNIDLYAMMFLEFESKDKLSMDSVKVLRDRFSEEKIYLQWEEVIRGLLHND
ncbi:hypothetical protein ACS79_21520 [Vibrio lentus]|nr:hypothetical protein ACS79_21520 [Vibrio lentus]